MGEHRRSSGFSAEWRSPLPLPGSEPRIAQSIANALHRLCCPGCIWWGYYYFSTTHCSLLGFIVWSGLDVPTFATRRLHECHHARANSGGRWNCEREMSGKFCLNAYFHVTFRNLLHTVKLRHKTDGFTSPLKEGVLRIFFPKIPTALAGFEPANLGTKGQRLIVQSGLDLSTLATRRLHACHHARVPSGGRWNCGREMSGKFCLKCRLTRYI